MIKLNFSVCEESIAKTKQNKTTQNKNKTKQKQIKSKHTPHTQTSSLYCTSLQQRNILLHSCVWDGVFYAAVTWALRIAHLL